MPTTELEEGARWAVEEALADPAEERHRHHRRSPAQPRFCTPRNPARPTLGHELVDVIRMLGFDPMPWQVLVADIALELDEDGHLVYREVVLIVPRRAGKTVLLLALRVWRALKGAEHWGAKQRTACVWGVTKNAAVEQFIDEEQPILKESLFGPHVRVRTTLGKEALLWRNGSRHVVQSASKKAGHSKGLDQVEIDEAFAVPDGRLEDGFGPPMLTRVSPQMWIVSAIGDLSDETQPSDWLWSKVETGRTRCNLIAEAVADGREAPTFASAYFEWSAPDDADPADPETWWSTHPAMRRELDDGTVVGTVTEKALRKELELRTLPTFKRAYLCIWPGARKHPRLVPQDVWRSERHLEADPRGEAAQFVGDLVLAIEAAPGCAAVSLVVSGRRADGALQVEVLKHAEGTLWVAQSVAKLVRARRCAVVMSKQSPAAALLPELERVELRSEDGEVESVVTVEVDELSTEDVFRAAEAWLLHFTAGDARHIGQGPLDAAVDVAVKQMYGKRFRFSTVDGGGDISPLDASALALWRALHPAAGAVRLRFI